MGSAVGSAVMIFSRYAGITISVIVTVGTILVFCLWLEKLKAENLNAVNYIGWGAALLVMEIFEYADIEEYLDSGEKFIAMLIGIASNAIFFSFATEF